MYFNLQLVEKFNSDEIGCSCNQSDCSEQFDPEKYDGCNILQDGGEKNISEGESLGKEEEEPVHRGEFNVAKERDGKKSRKELS